MLQISSPLFVDALTKHWLLVDFLYFSFLSVIDLKDKCSQSLSVSPGLPLSLSKKPIHSY